MDESICVLGTSMMMEDIVMTTLILLMSVAIYTSRSLIQMPPRVGIHLRR